LFVAAYRRHHAIVIVTCWVKSRHIFKINNRRWAQQYFSFLPAILETLLKLSSIYLPFGLFILHLLSRFFINFVTLPPNQFLAFHSQLLLLHLLVLLFLNLLVQLPLLLLCHLLFQLLLIPKSLLNLIFILHLGHFSYIWLSASHNLLLHRLLLHWLYIICQILIVS